MWHELLSSPGPNEASSLSPTTASTIAMNVTEGKSPATPHTENCNTSSQTVDTDCCTSERPFRYTSS
jgi:hypothetical protein